MHGRGLCIEGVFDVLPTRWNSHNPCMPRKRKRRMGEGEGERTVSDVCGYPTY